VSTVVSPLHRYTMFFFQKPRTNKTSTESRLGLSSTQSMQIISRCNRIFFSSLVNRVYITLRHFDKLSLKFFLTWCNTEWIKKTPFFIFACGGTPSSQGGILLVQSVSFSSSPPRASIHYPLHDHSTVQITPAQRSRMKHIS
jgi:hypothetical protein